MQTLKTAIVVVLLLTVTYAAYVALTAPTPELPAEVASLVEGGDFSLDDIGMGDIDAGMSTAGDPPTLDAGTLAATPDASTVSIGDSTSATARLSDQHHSSSDIAASNPTAGTDSDDASEAVTPKSLPKPDPSAGPVAADPAQQYPSTAFANFDIGSLEASADPATGPSANDVAEGTAGGEAKEPTASTDEQTHPGLVNAIATADRQWENDRLREALTTLSLFYNDPNLTEEAREPLQARLDMLAGEVIYSPRHLLEQPYRVRQGETLQMVAETYQVPWQLLANINAVDDPAAIVPGQELKIIRGPFRAEVNLQRRELTLFLGELYAGRFPITLGEDPAPQPGTYTVEDKQTARTYYPLNGSHIPAGDPRNPYGDVWLDLGNQMCIHGSPEAAGESKAGCIRLRAADAGDVYGILSQGSAVSILR